MNANGMIALTVPAFQFLMIYCNYFLKYVIKVLKIVHNNIEVLVSKHNYKGLN